jgi:polar amino acid transport system substrate-binding protein
MWVRFCILLVSLSIFTSSYAAPKQQVLLLTYHLKAPYVIDWGEQRGLYFDLAVYLNHKTDKYQFTTELIPRKRLDILLAEPFADVVIGVQPAWFAPLADKMLFTAPFLNDQDMFVSDARKPVRDKDLADLTGKTFIGSQGYKYKGIDEAVAAGTLERVDTLQEDYVLDMLRLGRGDFTIISSSTLSYKFSHGEHARHFYVATTPHDVIQRRFMLSKTDPQLYQFLQQVVRQMPADQEWQFLLAKYQIQQAMVKP